MNPRFAVVPLALAVVLSSRAIAGAQMPQPPMPQQPQRPMIEPTPIPAPTMMPTVPPTISPSPMPVPPSGSAVLPRAKEWMLRVETGRIDRSQLTAATNAALTASMAQRLKAAYGRLGTPIGFTFVSEQDLGNGNTAYTYRVRFERATLIEKFVLDGSGKISGLSFTPAS